jgi:protein involved in polysaccharide export with SLBB domain
MKKLLLVTVIIAISRIVSGAEGSALILNPGDGIRILIYNIPEKVSGDYFIQQDGNIQLPYLGIIPTSNRDYKEIKEEVVQKYDSLYRAPELTVQPLLKINILGEVKNPGFYVVTDVEKLSGLIALAGGETADADLDGIYLVRDNQEIEVGSESYSAYGKDINLESGDRFYVPRRWWVGARNSAIIISVLTLTVMIISLFVK